MLHASKFKSLFLLPKRTGSLSLLSEESLRLESQVEVFFKQVSSLLVEIYSLCGNNEFAHHSRWINDNIQLFRDFSSSMLEFTLFGISFNEISPTCTSIKSTKTYVKSIERTSLVLLDKLCNKKTTEVFLEIIYNLLRKELGYNVQEEKIFFRIVHSLNDAARSKRLCLLLDQAKVVLMRVEREYPTVVSRINKLVYEILFLCTAPSVIKCCSALQTVIKSTHLTAKISSGSYLNTFQIVNRHTSLLQELGVPKSQIKLNKKDATDVLEIKKIEHFLNGKVDASLMALLVARMGQMMNPVAEIKEENLNISTISKLVDLPIIGRANSNPPSFLNLYRCIIHQASEINFIHLVKVVYHLDQLYDLVAAQTIDNWKKFKEPGKIRMSRVKKAPIPEQEPQVETSSNDPFFYKVYETTLEGIPSENPVEKSDLNELPIGWYLNSVNNFMDLSTTSRDKKIQDKRKITKQWNLTDLTKIMDRIKQAQEKIVEPKEEDTDEVKDRFVKEVNSLIRLNEVCAFVIGLAQSLNKFGFAKLLFKGNPDRATEFAINMEAAIQGKVKPISYENFSKEVKAIMDVKDAKETQPDSKIDCMPVTVCNMGLFNQLKDIFDKIFALNHGNNRITEGLNNNLIVSTSLQTGSVRSDYINRVSSMLRKVYLDHNHPESQVLISIVKESIECLKSREVSTLDLNDRNLVLGTIALISGWEGSLATGNEVTISNSGSSKPSAVIKVPQNSGKLSSVVINNTDENISTQFVNYDLIRKKIEMKNCVLPQIDLGSLLDVFVKLEQILSEGEKDSTIGTKDSGFDSDKWSSLVSLKMASTLIIQSIYNHPRVMEELPKHPAFNVLISKSYESLGTPSLRLVFRNFIAWESIVDKMSKLSRLLFHPKGDAGSISPQFEKFMIIENKAAGDKTSLKNEVSKQATSYRLPASSYTECLPRNNPKATNYKMVKHWDKYIIPKVENFVRGTFSDFQMKDYFEQLRMTLRVQDHIRACGIAFKLCDWGLPNHCVVPDADYDWDTIDIEEIEVGSLVSVKLEYRHVALSNKIDHLVKIGQQEIVGEVLIVEHQMKYVLVLVRDHNWMQCMTLWAPQQCILPIEYPLEHLGQSNSYWYHAEEFNKRFKECQTFLAQNILMKTATLERGISSTIDSFKVMKWLIVSELNNNLISGWLEHQQRLPSEVEKATTLVSKVSKKEKSRLNFLEEDLYKICKEEKDLDHLITCIKEEANEIVKLLNENSYTTNLKDKSDIDVGQDKNISPLNIFEFMGAPKNSVCSIAITFDKAAYLGLTSGVKFFSDTKGVHLVNHIFNNQQDLTLSNIPPVLFQSNEIYYQSYYSVEGVPPWNRDRVQSNLPCIVHGIPYSWTPCCWMIDTLSSILIRYDDLKFVPKINELLKTGLKLSQEIKGPSIIKQMLYMLSNRLVRKMKCLVRKHQNEFLAKLETKAEDGSSKDYIQTLFDVEPTYVDALLDELKKILEIERDNELPNDKFHLFSAYTQDLIELLSAILAPMQICDKVFKDQREKPSKLDTLISFTQLMEHFKGKEIMTEKNVMKIKEQLSLKNQTKNFVLLNNLPKISKDELMGIILQTLNKRGGRVLSPYLDIYVAVDIDDKCSGMAVVFIEGWNIPESDEDLIVIEEKEEAPPEVPPEPIEPPELRWACPVCTLENEMNSDICMACESARPANPVIIGEIQPDAVEERVEPPAEDEVDAVRVKVWHQTLQEEIKKLIESKNSEQLKLYNDAVAAREAAEKERLAKEATKQAKKQKQGQEQSSPESKLDEAIPQEPIPPAKVIDFGKIDLKFGSDIITTSEIIEAILNRTVLDEFQKPLDKILEREYREKKEHLNSLFNVSDFEGFVSTVKDCEPQDFITNLAKMGIDFWLDKVYEENVIKSPVSESIIKELIQMIEKDICNESRFYSYFKSKDIRLVEKNPIILESQGSSEISLDKVHGFVKIPGFEAKFPELNKLTTLELRTIWEKLAVYNQYLLELLPMINMSYQCHAKMGDDLLTIGGYVSSLRYQCLSFVKSSVKTEIMAKTSLRTEMTPTIKVERLTEDMDSEKKEETLDQKESTQALWKLKDKFTFLRSFEQLKKIPVTLLRPEKVKGSGSFVAFKVVLEGEHVQGLAGPYRQFFADISAELQPISAKSAAKKALGMFIPTPNAEHKFGEDRHKFTINPSANSSFYLQLFETLGVLMGCAMRTDSHFTLDLPNLIWKKLIGVEVSMADLELVDKHFVENLRYLEDCDQTKFEQMAIDNFTTKLSDGSVVELLPNGSNVKVPFERKLEYMELSLKARLNECNKQIEAISKGLKQIIPEPYFNIITHRDLELDICGTNEIDFKLLKRNTIYSGGLSENSDLIKNFWTVLSEMKDNDKLKLIKFCWGQERLPATDDEYKRTQTRFMIKPSMSTSTDQNNLLPKADTCFFNLELPNYTTKDVLREKLVLVINLDCDSMNAEIVINELHDNDRDYDEFAE